MSPCCPIHVAAYRPYATRMPGIVGTVRSETRQPQRDDEHHVRHPAQRMVPCRLEIVSTRSSAAPARAGASRTSPRRSSAPAERAAIRTSRRESGWRSPNRKSRQPCWRRTRPPRGVPDLRLVSPPTRARAESSRPTESAPGSTAQKARTKSSWKLYQILVVIDVLIGQYGSDSISM